MKAIRIFFRNIRDGFKSVGRNFSLSLASISCITITLLVVAVALIVASNIENMTKLVKEDFTIVTFLDLEVDKEKKEELTDSIKNIKNVDIINFDGNSVVCDLFRKSDYYFEHFEGEKLGKLLSGIAEEIFFNISIFSCSSKILTCIFICICHYYFI